MKESIYEEVDEELEYEDEESSKDIYLSFNIDNDYYCLNIYSVIEIIRMPKISYIPDTEEYIKGVINLRGIAFPVMDLRLRFGYETQESNDRTCVIIVSNENYQFGLIVDSVSEVITIDNEKIQESNTSSFIRQSKFINALAKIDSKIYMVVSLGEILSDTDHNLINNL